MADVTAVQDRLTVDRDADVKPYIGMPSANTDFDTMLDLLIDSAKESADHYMNRPFYQRDDDGAIVEDSNGDPIEEAIPASVKLGVLALVKMEFRRTDPDVTTKKDGDLSFSRSGGGMNPGGGLEGIQAKYWAKYRLEPGL